MANGKWQMANGGLAVTVISVIFFSLFNLNPAGAVGLVIKPKELNLSAQARKEATAEFLVINVAAEPALYKVSPDALADKIKLEPADFQLEPNASQLVKVKVKISEPGRYQTDISIIARPLGAGGLAVASGVKLPLTIVVGGLVWWQHALGLGALLAVCLLAVFGVKWRRVAKLLS